MNERQLNRDFRWKTSFSDRFGRDLTPGDVHRLSAELRVLRGFLSDLKKILHQIDTAAAIHGYDLDCLADVRDGFEDPIVELEHEIEVRSDALSHYEG